MPYGDRGRIILTVRDIHVFISNKVKLRDTVSRIGMDVNYVLSEVAPLAMTVPTLTPIESNMRNMIPPITMKMKPPALSH